MIDQAHVDALPLRTEAELVAMRNRAFAAGDAAEREDDIDAILEWVEMIDGELAKRRVERVYSKSVELLDADGGDGFGRFRLGYKTYRFPTSIVTERWPLDLLLRMVELVGPPHEDGITSRYRDPDVRAELGLDDEVDVVRGGEMYEMMFCDEYARFFRERAEERVA